MSNILTTYSHSLLKNVYTRSFNTLTWLRLLPPAFVIGFLRSTVHPTMNVCLKRKVGELCLSIPTSVDGAVIEIKNTYDKTTIQLTLTTHTTRTVHDIAVIERDLIEAPGISGYQKVLSRLELENPEFTAVHAAYVAREIHQLVQALIMADDIAGHLTRPTHRMGYYLGINFSRINDCITENHDKIQYHLLFGFDPFTSTLRMDYIGDDGDKAVTVILGDNRVFKENNWWDIVNHLRNAGRISNEELALIADTLSATGWMSIDDSIYETKPYANRYVAGQFETMATPSTAHTQVTTKSETSSYSEVTISQPIPNSHCKLVAQLAIESPATDTASKDRSAAFEVTIEPMYQEDYLASSTVLDITGILADKGSESYILMEGGVPKFLAFQGFEGAAMTDDVNINRVYTVAVKRLFGQLIAAHKSLLQGDNNV